MRLDKFLKVSRVIKRRTVANEACDAGRVVINGKVAKASHDVKVGDIVEIKYGEKIIKFKITSIDAVVKKTEAAGMVEFFEDSDRDDSEEE
ncbi:MAG: RNA-binding S4 domain-containing protein [Clostridia bacterium]|nr:RNA-binding S4 domain-containing protein [Clostridia bacterium]